MKKIIQEDDCAPDAFEYFNIKFQEITGMDVYEFQEKAERNDDEMTIRYVLGKYILEYAAYDPFYLLLEDEM